MGIFADADVNAVAALLARVAASAGTTPDRRVLMEGLADLLSADVWSWFVARGAADPGRRGVRAGDGKHARRRTLLTAGPTPP